MRDQDDSLYPFFNNLPEAQSGADLFLIESCTIG
jgi:hypothetical protein